MQKMPAGCFMRRSGTKWHAFWNEYATKEKPAKGKGGGSSFEYRLLCGCYKQVPQIDTTYDESPEDTGPKDTGVDQQAADPVPQKSEDVVVKPDKEPDSGSSGDSKPPTCEIMCTIGEP